MSNIYEFTFNKELAHSLRNYNSYSVVVQYCNYIKSYLNKIKNKEDKLKAIKAFRATTRTEELYMLICKIYIYTNVKFIKIIFDKLGTKILEINTKKLYQLSQCLDKNNPQVYNNICTYIAVMWKQRIKYAIEKSSNYEKTINEYFQVIDNN